MKIVAFKREVHVNLHVKVDMNRENIFTVKSNNGVSKSALIVSDS